MTDKRLGVGIVGSGFMANFHIRSWQGVRHADIRAICSLDAESAQAAAALCTELHVGRPRVYSDVSQLVEDPNVDAVWIVTPNSVRLSLVEAIVDRLRRGKAELRAVACEKPLARSIREARTMIELAREAELLHGYLENQVHAPSLTKTRDLVWGKGVPACGRPYLVRCSEEHSGPHKPWFWIGAEQGGGVLSDMMCHSIEASRFLLSSADAEQKLMPVSVSAQIDSLKWTRPEYVEKLRKASDGAVDYATAPAEDYARATIAYRTEDGERAISDVATSWAFVGPGLRLSFEVFGPEYSASIDSLSANAKVFFSREVARAVSEELVEKHNSDHGLMPILEDEAVTYGYTAENREMVSDFVAGRQPRESWDDGLKVLQIMMACYMSAERGCELSFPPQGLDEFVPKVAQGTWKPA